MPINTKLPSLQPSRITLKSTTRLISGGYFAREAFPDGTIDIFPWDNEIYSWIQERVKHPPRETFIYDLAAKLCATNGVNILDFPIGEINMVLLVARAAANDKNIVYTSRCTKCGHEARETIEVPKDLTVMGEKSADYPGYDDIILPKSEDVVSVRPLTGHDVLSIERRPPEMKKAIPRSVAVQITAIQAVGGGRPDALDEVHKYLRALSPIDQQFLEDEINNLSPHLDTSIPHICNECGHRFNHALDFDDEFFRPNRRRRD